MEQFTTKYHQLQYAELLQKRFGQYEEYKDGLLYGLASLASLTGLAWIAGPVTPGMLYLVRHCQSTKKATVSYKNSPLPK